MNFVPLWAIALEDVIGLLLVILVVVVPVIRQVLKALAEAQKPGGGAMPPRRPPATVDKEIEEFLRRAGKARATRESRQGQKPGPAGQPQRPAPGRPAAAARRPEGAVTAEVVEEPPTGRGVGKHVEQFLDAGEFARRSSQLGAEVTGTDAQIDQHMRSVFDHEVSRLGAPTDAAAAAAPGALNMLALLGSTQSFAQAIVVSEILRRPEERWA